MAKTTLNPAKSAFSRVFIIEGGASPGHTPSYKSCAKLTGLDQSFGDVEKIECPDPYEYGKFVEIGQIKSGEERVTTSIVSRYALDITSEILKLARRGCIVDVHAHFGQCENPSQFNKFTKGVIIEDAYLTSFSTEDMGTLASADNAKIDETGEVSGARVYEVVPLRALERGADVVTDQILDVIFCSTISCPGDCTEEDDGCEVIFAVTSSSTGSPGSPPDLLYSQDSGATFAADAVTSLTPADDADGVGCLGDYVVIVSNDDDAIHYKAKAAILAGAAGDWVLEAAGVVGAGSPMAIWSTGSYAYVVGDGGYVYGTEDATSGLTVLDAGSATPNNLLKVHALNDDVAVAVGANGAVVYTTDKGTWALAAAPVAAQLNCVCVLSENVWIVGADNGNYYYTMDQGATWHQGGNMPVTPISISGLAFSTKSVGYMTVVVAGPNGRLLRTFDGGHSWTLVPEKVGHVPANDELTCVAACEHDENMVIAGGLADNGTDGILVLGIE